MRMNFRQEMDGANFKLTLNLEGIENLYLPKDELVNERGNTIASIYCVGGKVKAYVNITHAIRANNVQPFGISDLDRLEIIKSEIIEFLDRYLKRNLKERYDENFIKCLTVSELECNTTLSLRSDSTVSSVISLFDYAFDRTVVFRKMEGKYQKVNTGCLYTKPKQYKLKIYNKTDEMKSKGDFSVEPHCLRIEVIFIDRYLNRLYGNKRSINDILTRDSIMKLCAEYKCVLEEEIINKSLKPFLSYCTQTLFESMKNSESGNAVNEAIAKHKDLIVDMKILEKAVRKYNVYRNIPDNTNQVIYYYRKKNFGIPEDVLQTIKIFHNSVR